jgi:hypothetical protein
MTGLDATPCGSDASADCTADFTGSTVTQSPPSGLANQMLVTHSQTLGTTIAFLPGSEGKWSIRFNVPTQTAATVFAGISYNGNAAALNTNPSYTNSTILVAAQRIAAGADTDEISIAHEIDVTYDQVNTPTSNGAIVRIHLSNGANASAAAAALVLTEANVDIVYLGPID